MILEEFGDVRIPENDRALIARITPICILCGRGIYKLKQDNYITKELANKIYEYIDKSENSVFLTNTLFSVFEDELLSCGIDNKYYLQGVLHELLAEAVLGMTVHHGTYALQIHLVEHRQRIELPAVGPGLQGEVKTVVHILPELVLSQQFVQVRTRTVDVMCVGIVHIGLVYFISTL